MVDIGAMSPIKKNKYRKLDSLVSLRARIKAAPDEVTILTMEETPVMSSPFRKARPSPPSLNT
ncbi:hypothetical protein D3C78_1447290 [compost metagenome]